MIERVSAFIDIEGFGALYRTNNDSIWGLQALMRGIYILGQRSRAMGISRLFAYHIGDAFVVVDDGGAADVNRMLGLMVALFQYTLMDARHFCKATIDMGETADVVGCYPEEVREALANGSVPLGEGVMTISPVIGSSFINTYRIQKDQRCRKGSTIVLPEKFESSLNSGFRWEKEGKYLYVDWVGSITEGVRRARAILGVDGISPTEWMTRIENAIAVNECPEEWIQGTWRGLGRRPP